MYLINKNIYHNPAFFVLFFEFLEFAPLFSSIYRVLVSTWISPFSFWFKLLSDVFYYYYSIIKLWTISYCLFLFYVFLYICEFMLLRNLSTPDERAFVELFLKRDLLGPWPSFANFKPAKILLEKIAVAIGIFLLLSFTYFPIYLIETLTSSYKDYLTFLKVPSIGSYSISFMI